MYCPQCHHPNHALAETCASCDAPLGRPLQQVRAGRQFVFVDASPAAPVAISVDGEIRTVTSRTILSRHRHAVDPGDEAATWAERARVEKEIEALDRRIGLSLSQGKRLRELRERLNRLGRVRPLGELPRLPRPELQLTAAVTDRAIYRPGDDVTVFVVAPAEHGREAGLELRLGGQKMYEAKVPLNDDGIGLHTCPEMREGQYTVHVLFADRPEAEAEAAFSVAEFTLSPLIATLAAYRVEGRRLHVQLDVKLLSQPYTGPAEVRLDCAVCRRGARRSDPSGEWLRRWREGWREETRVGPALHVQVDAGRAEAAFDLCNHDGPFRLELTTPQGHTASVTVPNLAAGEREHITINPLGRHVQAGLAPWDAAQGVRGLYLGPGQSATTPLALRSACADQGELDVLTDAGPLQIVLFDALDPEPRVVERAARARGETLAFAAAAPYTLFTVGAFTAHGAFEGWGVVIKPVGLDAALSAPKAAAPGDEIEVWIEGLPEDAGAYCWLLAYDARLEHESPLPKLGKRVYQAVREATAPLGVRLVPSPEDEPWYAHAFGEGQWGFVRSLARGDTGVLYMAEAAQAKGTEVETEAETLELVESPARMAFPELVHNELFYVAGAASRTIRLGDQIGAWRVRAYLCRGADLLELTADVQAEKRIYAEPDLPALAAEGDEIIASVRYQAGPAAELVISTPYGETRVPVAWSGSQRFTMRGPGRVEVRLAGEAGEDWTARDVAPPGVQRVVASQLMLLRQGETAAGERVVVFPGPGYALADTVQALLQYPFG